MSRLTIFEGPDGGGKSTAARRYAEETRAHYVHLGPFKGVTDIARFYAEAMQPAILGLHDVVMDRSWLSERIYADAFRNGEDRLGRARCRILERMAFRASTVVVLCNPGWQTVQANFGTKPEMLTTDLQLRHVYLAYRALRSSLPLVEWDYLLNTWDELKELLHPLHGCRSVAHPLAQTAGNWVGSTLLVGEVAGGHKACDALYQYPFGSFSQTGCSMWLTNQLERARMGERELLWVNADEVSETELIGLTRGREKVIAFGAEAGNRLKGCDATLPHPSYWRRFHANEPYQLQMVLAA